MSKRTEQSNQRIRRQLLRGGVGAPVLLTIGSGPVLAGTGTGKAYTASAYCSAKVNASATTRGQCAATGWKPSTWCTTNTNNWPNGCKSTVNYHGSTVSKQFNGSYCGAKTHKQVMQAFTGGTASGTKDKLACYLSAAMANYHSGKVHSSILDPTSIRAIWDACSAGGYWTPAGTQLKWDTATVCAWIESHWTA